METEKPYFDKNGKEIKQFAVIKIFHFKGTNEQGRGRKLYYMYKWVQLREWQNKLYWVALHLTDDKGDFFHLRSISDIDRKLEGVEIVQTYN